MNEQETKPDQVEKRPYVKPAFVCERVFEITALGCGLRTVTAS